MPARRPTATLLIAQTVVGTSAWVIHRVSEIWGPDVDEFRPERWLDKNKGSNLSKLNITRPEEQPRCSTKRPNQSDLCSPLAAVLDPALAEVRPIPNYK